MKKIKEKGITLVALIITIIILLILAGITIGELTGNGIFDMAKGAKEKYENAAELENSILSGYQDALGGNIPSGNSDSNNLPENTPTTEVGTEVKLEDGWGTETVRYFKTSDGTEVQALAKVATVYAVSVGGGNTVPVPYGFYYVGGTIDTGVIISDNEADKYVAGTDKTTHEYAVNLVGNQFVWIPASKTTYVKNATSWGKSDDDWDTTTPASELTQIEKYGGFYVARYEAGLDVSKAHSSNQEWNATIHDAETAKPQSKANLIPWNFVSWNTSKARSEEMYKNVTFTRNGTTYNYSDYINTGLITGTQWDTMITKIAEKESVSLTASDWGNYDDVSISYRGQSAYYGSNLETFKSTNDNPTPSSTGTRYLLYTGASNTCKKYNLYDVAGNVWEWTEEASLYNNDDQYRVFRGR